MTAVIEPMTLITSELVGNAVRYGRPPLQMLLRRVGSGVRIDIHDEMPSREPQLPATLPADPDAEGGRGLALVQALAADLGVDQIDNDGKRVWAVVRPNDAD